MTSITEHLRGVQRFLYPDSSYSSVILSAAVPTEDRVGVVELDITPSFKNNKLEFDRRGGVAITQEAPDVSPLNDKFAIRSSAHNFPEHVLRSPLDWEEVLPPWRNKGGGLGNHERRFFRRG